MKQPSMAVDPLHHCIRVDALKPVCGADSKWGTFYTPYVKKFIIAAISIG